MPACLKAHVDYSGVPKAPPPPTPGPGRGGAKARVAHAEKRVNGKRVIALYWSADDTAKLAKLRADGYTWQYIAAALRRSRGSCQTKAYTMGLRKVGRVA